ncbi:MAG: YqgE/AlgH family protein [Gammaproteobacteria bacterium]|nr:YqgE/AlgH family protein [Gammaproteobacteria bacterium]
MSGISTDALAGRLLIATPSMQDPNFAKSVILVCEHNADGALGLAVNRKLPLQLGQVLSRLDLPVSIPEFKTTPLFSGGPVQGERGFVLHDSPGMNDDSLALGDSLAVSASEAVLATIAEGAGPRRFMLMLGYSGWGAGQLEQEFADNAWLAVPATPQLIFETAVEERWHQAAALIGLDLARFSTQIGHA